MKRILSICLVLMMVLALAPTAFAAGQFDWKYEEETYTLKIGGKFDGEFESAADTPWAKQGIDITQIKHIWIDRRDKAIPDNAFKGMTGVVSVDFENPDANNQQTHIIGEGAFAGCTSLTSVHLPGNLQSLGDGAFAGCTSLTEVTFNGSGLSVGEGVFAGCSSLTLDGIADLADFVNTDDVLGLPEIKNLALGLSDDILVMFRVYVPANVTTSDFSVHFTTKYEGVTYRDVTVAYNDAKPIDGALNDRYFCLNITAQELADDITAQVYIGSEATGEPKALSAMYYINYVKDNYAPDSALYKLVDALQAYGYYLQNSGWTDNFGPHATISAPALTIDTDYVARKVANFGVTYSSEQFPSGVTVSLTLNTKTSIKVRDKATNEIATQTGIGPTDLASQYEISLTNGKVSAYALSYVKLVLNSSLTAAKKDAMAALYYYYEAAEAYN